jgi:metal-responsive CopG/Arc/MetJ family transcriptional regulator
MSVAKIAITIDEGLLFKVDRLVRGKHFANRSKKIQRYDRSRLARECAKLDPKIEQAMAEEGISLEAKQWPPY